ncbi:prepilin peptidase [Campylobacter sp. JMF_04 NA10]|uniref:prepilin peptidase n=1 Tax=Campylobacter sp. JMF_04 NA10 TaxID=2983824 RepID=UPI0022EA03A1|nr:A24 family peptidase [Campylobacter sp. JMF_04 NA10]MDA3076658.1 prepilin peptidase [Campylobacter sp. JMF_04 NA10]
MEYYLYMAIFALFGICVGSFSNVLIHRLPRGESINFPASHCPKCGTPLKFYHNVPLFSWLFLGGKCAFCKEKISIRYPIVEFLAGALAASAYICELDIIKAAILALLFILLLALSAIDFEFKAVPDSLLFTATALSLVYPLLYDFDISLLYPAAGYGLAFFALRLIITKVLKREAMGSADIFIAIIIGAILGWKLGGIAIYIGAILTLPAYAIANKKGYELPFVPFLSAGLLLTILFKAQILELLEMIYG